MTRPPQNSVLPERSTIGDAFHSLNANQLGIVFITNAQGKVIGCVTDGDIRRHAGAGIEKRKASEVMTAGPKVARPDQLAAEALALMTERKITQLFVLEAASPAPLGVIHIHDCLRAGLA